MTLLNFLKKTSTFLIIYMGGYLYFSGFIPFATKIHSDQKQLRGKGLVSAHSSRLSSTVSGHEGGGDLE